MTIIKINDIGNQVEELITRVQAGETILIEKNGEIVAELLAKTQESKAKEARSRKKIDIAALQEFTRSLPFQEESTADFIRRMRDEARY